MRSDSTLHFRIALIAIGLFTGFIATFAATAPRRGSDAAPGFTLRLAAPPPARSI